MIRVSVLIPTFRRPDGLRRAVRSVFAQTVTDGVELVAVDNSPEGSSRAALAALEAEAPIPFRWAHEPRAGVAHARNAALALARGEIVVWLDDDEEAPPHWLGALLRVQTETGADCVFGPVRAQAPECTPARAFFEHLYARAGDDQSGLIARTYGAGNSLQVRGRMYASSAPFDPRANETGGEDDRLFAEARANGARFAWAATAWVTEHLDPQRVHVAHALKRAFAYGQGPCETAWLQRDFIALLRHMSIGAAQACVFAIGGLIAFAASATAALQLLDRAARGAGKVFWFCEQRFYGETLARRQPA